MDKLCENLLITYDTNILDNTDKKTQNIWKKTSVDILENPDKYKKTYKSILTRLVYNHFHNQKPDNKYVEGPMNCTYWISKKYNKQIYIFGETHEVEKKCKNVDGISIRDYLKKLYETTDVFIDFFLEIEKFNIDNPYKNRDDTTTLEQLRNGFSKCIHPKTRQDKFCSLARTHYIDIRYRSDIEFVKWTLYLYILDGEDLFKKINKNKISFLNYIESITVNKMDFLEQIAYIYEELVLKKILKNREYGIEIYKYFENIMDFYINIHYDTIKKNALNILKIKGEIDEKIREEYKKEFQDISVFCINMITYMTDAYTLSRIFNEFNTDNNFDGPTTPTNIIIYVGDSHAETYRTFLLTRGFELIQSTGKTIYDRYYNYSDINNNGCIDMSEFGKLFSKYNF